MTHVADFPCLRTIELAWAEGRYMTSAVRLFRQFVIEYFAELEGFPSFSSPLLSETLME
jgi:DNA-binding transcriptional LysR family regulator